MNRPLLNLAGLTKRFRGPDGSFQTIVDIERFSLDATEQVALRGASGSGKTTVLNLIAGILTPDAGQITVDGTDLTQISESRRDRFRARTLGYVFQNFNLLQGYTALENVLLGMLFGPGVDEPHARELLDRVGLTHRLHHKPAQLSIGQQQRVAVARALANRPKLVLADEPTGNLDEERAQDALALIRDVCRENGTALLLVSHDPAILRAFERTEDLGLLNRATTLPAATGVM